MRHHEFNNGEIALVYFTKQDPDTDSVCSVLRGRIRTPSKTGPDPHTAQKPLFSISDLLKVPMYEREK
jgi:hypothetical protein